MKEWKLSEVKSSTVESICLAADENSLIGVFRRTKKGETFFTACLNRLRSAEHKSDLKN